MSGPEPEPATEGGTHRELDWGPRWRQPDRLSCGPTSLVVARMLRDPTYRPGDFGGEVLRLHEEFTWLRGADGRLQLPYPRRGGTALWQPLARLARIEGVPYRWRVCHLTPGHGFDHLLRAALRGRLSSLYVGTSALARHVTLVIGVRGDTLRVFDPATGQVHGVSRRMFVDREIGLGGWPRAWWVIVPRGC